jgi:hypothetical protein
MTRYWLGIATATILGCSHSTGPSPVESYYSSNLQKWKTTGPASYQMEVGRSCSCPPSATVLLTVRNQVVESRVYTDTGQPVPAENASEFPDVPTLFSLIRYALDHNYYSLGASYHITYGYPVLVQLDPSGSTVDDNIDYLVLSLEPLP